MEVPQDVAFEIFSRLPAKSICKLQPTCKPFSKFLEETIFKTKQAQNLFGKDDTCLFIQPYKIGQRYVNVTKRVELHSLPEHRQSSGVPNNVLNFLSNSVSVIGSSNGLVLCHTIDDDPVKFFVLNPITKSWYFIPTPESLQRNNNFTNVDLVLHCTLDDYKVFLFENTMESWPSSFTCSVYNGKEGVWKTMERDFMPGGRDMKFDMPVFYNGALHFISTNGRCFAKFSPFYDPYIMSYNLEDGISSMLSLPREAIEGCDDACNMGIFNWGKASNSNQSICLVNLIGKSIFTVWYLKDYESALWEKVLNVNLQEFGLEEEDHHDITGFTVMNGNLLVFATEERVYSCGLEGEIFMMIEEICQHNCGLNPRFISYSDTLRSCGINAQNMPC